MSEAITTPESAAPAKPSWLWVLFANSPYILIYIATIWLVATTDGDPENARNLWQWFIPVVGLVSVFGGWAKTRDTKTRFLTEQVLHWGALMGVAYLLFLPEMEFFMNAESHGVVMAYLVGLAAILSGIYLDWKMAIYGLFLVGSAYAIGFLDDNAMIITLIGSGILVLVITLLVRKAGKQ
jgi:hypothetical protein